MAALSASLKLLIDLKSKRVLFAEAGKDFVDFLFNLLSLPLGTVIRLLTKQGMVGCLGNLYDSVENLGDDYMQSAENKETLLKPMVVNYAAKSVPLLLSNMESSTFTTNLYRCGNGCCDYAVYDPSAKCPGCKRVMNRRMTIVDPKGKDSSSGDEGYVKGVVTYMVMDDLVVRPMSTISSIALLNKFKVQDVGSLQEKVIALGVDEGLKLLKASLRSKNVLTDVFLGKEEI